MVATAVLERQPTNMTALRGRALVASNNTTAYGGLLQQTRRLESSNAAAEDWLTLSRVDPSNVITIGNLGVSRINGGAALSDLGRPRARQREVPSERRARGCGRVEVAARARQPRLPGIARRRRFQRRARRARPGGAPVGHGDRHPRRLGPDLSRRLLRAPVVVARVARGPGRIRHRPRRHRSRAPGGQGRARGAAAGRPRRGTEPPQHLGGPAAPSARGHGPRRARGQRPRGRRTARAMARGGAARPRRRSGLETRRELGVDEAFPALVLARLGRASSRRARWRPSPWPSSANCTRFGTDDQMHKGSIWRRRWSHRRRPIRRKLWRSSAKRSRCSTRSRREARAPRTTRWVDGLITETARAADVDPARVEGGDEDATPRLDRPPRQASKVTVGRRPALARPET